MENPEFNARFAPDVSELKCPRYKSYSTMIPQEERLLHMKNFLGNHLFRFGDTDRVKEEFWKEAKKCVPPFSEKELQDIYSAGQEWYGKLATSQAHKQAAQNAEKWRKPRKIEEIALVDFPSKHFPRTIAQYVEAVTEFTETAPEMCGILMFGTLSGIFQRKYEIISTAGNTETLSVYTVACATSSERKSAVIAKLITPILAFQKEYNNAHKDVISEGIAVRKYYERELGKIEKSGSQDELIAAQVALDALNEDKPLSLLSQDVTPEAIVRDMKDNGERTIIASAEGGFFEKINGRYSPNAADHEIYLQAHGGDFISIKRIGRPPDELERPAIAILLGTQPSVLHEFMANPKFSGNGLTARFYYSVCEERAGNGRKPKREKSPAYYEAIFDSYFNLVRKAMNHTMNVKETRYISLSDAADTFACEYFYICETRIKESMSEPWRAWNGKSFGGFIKIAGLFHCIECVERDISPDKSTVSLENVQRAALFMDCIYSHAKKLHSATDKLNRDAIYLFKRMQEEMTKRDGTQPKYLSKREIMRLTHGRFKTADDLTPALELLVDCGYISTNFLQTGGRPSERIEVNPLIN